MMPSFVWRGALAGVVLTVGSNITRDLVVGYGDSLECEAISSHLIGTARKGI